MQVELRLEQPVEGRLEVFGDMHVAGQQLLQTSVLVELSPANLKGGLADIVVGVYADGRRASRFKTGFIGPRTTAASR
jgi:hypothetical protein